ncbi:response regulator [Bradyrhizobium sp. ma5]|uniref:response regulator n=1 Tax=unclassified Bradyrhizobium TaxID=2631580 RepID=UPI001CC38027|nr:response regulator [Bradyrhizobium sp. RD5-C2]GIQ73168.1 response regulator [Bradyrhizobium sp. RD5-C2]
MLEQPVLLILVVEDEVFIQELVEEALADGGFKTESVSSGEKAIALLENDQQEYRALITDIHLPGALSGWDVARRARELNGQMPVVYMTSGAADEWAAQGVPNSIILQKPFALAQVVTAISQLLNQVPPTQE